MLAVHVVPPAESAAPFLLADLTDFGQTVECLAGVESVVHLAAIPASGFTRRRRPSARTCSERTTSSKQLGSSACAGSCGCRARRFSACRSSASSPHTRRSTRTTRLTPNRATRCRRCSRRSSAGNCIAGRACHTSRCGFRTSWNPPDYDRFPSYWEDPSLRRWNLYIHARDVAESCRLALEAEIGAEHFILAAADTVMNRPSRKLMAEVFPTVP